MPTRVRSCLVSRLSAFGLVGGTVETTFAVFGRVVYLL